MDQKLRSGNFRFVTKDDIGSQVLLKTMNYFHSGNCKYFNHERSLQEALSGLELFFDRLGSFQELLGQNHDIAL